jgi:16S rRNA (guanine527-N7)-methyltransferase
LCTLYKGIEKLNIPGGEKIIPLLTAYIGEIELFNSAYGLVGADNTEDLVIRHILDSLAPAGIIARLLAETGGVKAADAGSGAGLPGIPLAITLPEYNFTLIEKMGRRAGFLLNTTAVLKLSNVTVEEKELEKIPKELFNLVTFRAFKPIEQNLLKTLFGICADGGIIAAYKGKREKINEEMGFYKGQWEAIPCPVPFLDEERHLLVIRK